MIRVRAPGRINLIGEHTDYSLLPVMPMAIDRQVVVSAEPRADGLVEVTSDRFPGERHLGPLDGPAEGWARFVLAALTAVEAPSDGVTIHVGGDLPHTGGLSSSSALTVGVLAAVDRLWGLGLGPTRYPRLASAAERSISIDGGLMDQTVIALALAGDALRIDFRPPKVTPVPIPSGIRFVAASSGVAAPKQSSVRSLYEARVVGARLAAALLRAEVPVSFRGGPILRPFVDREDIHERIDRLPETADAGAVASAAGFPPEVLLGTTTIDVGVEVPVRMVARHVIDEARRVDHAEAALRGFDYAGFGRLLDDSHRSLQRFGASIPALDRLVSAMRAAGAYGARLTGAGFGGYAIAAVPPALVDDVVEAGVQATGGPAFAVQPSDGVSDL